MSTGGVRRHPRTPCSPPSRHPAERRKKEKARLRRALTDRASPMKTTLYVYLYHCRGPPVKQKAQEKCLVHAFPEPLKIGRWAVPRPAKPDRPCWCGFATIHAQVTTVPRPAHSESRPPSKNRAGIGGGSWLPPVFRFPLRRGGCGSSAPAFGTRARSGICTQATTGSKHGAS
jgi:hypothetical protein